MENPSSVDQDGAHRERALRETGEVMLMIEAAVRRVDQALTRLAQDPVPDLQTTAGLSRAKRDLEALRRRLHHEVYLHSDTLPFG